MVQVESEVIAEIAYDASKSTLFVRFVHGDWYSYFVVPERTYEAFVAAESHGHFFQDHIRDHFPYRRGR
jgi:KTSC domain